MTTRGVYTALPPCQKLTIVGITLESFNKYIKQALMVFEENKRNNMEEV